MNDDPTRTERVGTVAEMLLDTTAMSTGLASHMLTDLERKCLQIGISLGSTATVIVLQQDGLLEGNGIERLGMDL